MNGSRQQLSKRRLMLLFASTFWSLVLVSLVACGQPKEQGHEGHLHVSASLEAKEPKTGKNILQIEVKDHGGKAIADATITVKPHMPAHGHGSTETPKIESLGEGKYKASPVTFQMPGEWEIVVEAKKGSEHGKTTLKVQVK